MSEAKGKNFVKVESGKETLSRLVFAACELDLPFALYRLPGQKDSFHFQTSLSAVKEVFEINLEEMEKGFLMSEFDGKKYYLKADISWESGSGDLNIRQTLDGSDLLDGIMKKIQEEPGKISLTRKTAGETEKTDKSFLELVEDCIQRISNGEFEKIVPARAHLVNDYDESQVIDFFLNLCENYEQAFVSLFSSPETGTWLGATPEILVKTRAAQEFETVALAGTQLFKGQDLKSVAWTQKEIEEQAMVSRYIINAFKRIRLREFDEIGPKTVVAGNLLHLKTTYSVDMKATNFPELGSVMLRLLHPTSAVCGMPREKSLEFLKQSEHLDRRFYSGYLGPVNVNSSTDIFVNLRCLEFVTEGIKLYAGAGVTADSDPEKELEETEYKFDTLRKILLQS